MMASNDSASELGGRRFAPRPGGWKDDGQVAEYLDRMTDQHPRVAGEDTLVSALPAEPLSVLDLGAGDGRLGALVASARPTVERVVLVDNSPAMIDRAQAQFGGDARFKVHAHDLEDPVGGFGRFDVVVSGMAIHHLHDDRKQTLFREIADCLETGGLFANLEVVRSPSPELHRAFLDAVGREADDPADRLVDVWTQMGWLEDAGFTHVDCLWKWRGLALIIGTNTA